MEPYLVVALPLWTETFVPVNVTGLVREWELMLDPVRALRQAAEEYLADEWDWALHGRFTVPGPETQLAKDASRDDPLVEMFRKSRCRLISDDGPEIVSCTFDELLHDVIGPGESELSEQARPVLLGLAVAASVRTPVGMNGVRLKAKASEERRLYEQQREQMEIDTEANRLREALDSLPDGRRRGSAG